MYKILTLNNISVAGLERLPRENYEVASEIQHPDAILLRSFKMHEMEIPPTLKAVGRAGAGVNNIPVEKMSAAGIPVFNAPGANANAVKELVVTGMLLACRNIYILGIDDVSPVAAGAHAFTRHVNRPSEDRQEVSGHAPAREHQTVLCAPREETRYRSKVTVVGEVCEDL